MPPRLGQWAASKPRNAVLLSARARVCQCDSAVAVAVAVGRAGTARGARSAQRRGRVARRSPETTPGRGAAEMSVAGLKKQFHKASQVGRRAGRGPGGGVPTGVAGRGLGVPVGLPRAGFLVVLEGAGAGSGRALCAARGGTSSLESRVSGCALAVVNRSGLVVERSEVVGARMSTGRRVTRTTTLIGIPPAQVSPAFPLGGSSGRCTGLLAGARQSLLWLPWVWGSSLWSFPCGPSSLTGLELGTRLLPW